MKSLRVASVQFCHVAGDKAANRSTIGRFVEEAAAAEVELICFPECCVSGYWHLRNLTRSELTDLAEEIPRTITAQRSYEANLTVIKTRDEMLGTLVDIVG